MTTIYVDGCSYFAGYGLDPEYSLGNLLSNKFDVLDRSKVGKSNYAIALDFYSQKTIYDFYIIGWTFSSRMEFNINGSIIDSSVSRDKINLGAVPNGEYLENEYSILQQKFFRYSSRSNQFNDFLIDATSELIKTSKIFLSWEHRHCKTDLIYPNFSSKFRQNDMPEWKMHGHLNVDGMKLLSELVIQKINEKK